ncbi:MAG: RNase adapter RapZ, partial [Pseudomonadota bacterium]|nr:RNase adapter RapZ [Pseudomonadota bacterium]
VAIGCTGGQHRSVYMIERLAKHFSQKYPDVLVRHQETNIKTNAMR